MKDNIKRELERRGILQAEKKAILNEIFGKQEDEVKYEGLVDCNDEDEFTSKLEALENR